MMEDLLHCKDLYDPIEIVTNSDGSVSKPSKPYGRERLGKVKKIDFMEY